MCLSIYHVPCAPFSYMPCAMCPACLTTQTYVPPSYAPCAQYLSCIPTPMCHPGMCHVPNTRLFIFLSYPSYPLVALTHHCDGVEIG